MKNFDLTRQYNAIVNLIDNTRKSCGDNLELQGHWGKYICVLASGFLENAISEVYRPLIGKSASPAVAAFTMNVLDSIQNPKSKRFVETAATFKKEWGDELEAFFKANVEVKTAIDSIMSNRHLIAHGKSTSISVTKVKEYLENSVKAIELIEGQCGYTSIT